jgi:hypothetical protein
MTPEARWQKAKNHMVVVENPFEDKQLFAQSGWSSNGLMKTGENFSH